MSKDTKPTDTSAELAALRAELAALQTKMLALAGAQAKDAKSVLQPVPGRVTYRLLKPRYSKGKLYAKGEMITVENAVPSPHWVRVDAAQAEAPAPVESKPSKRASDSE